MLGVTPNIVSLAGLLALIGFIIYAISHPIYAVGFLSLHILFDALDGSLARYMKLHTDTGALVDMICDHTGMIVVAATLAYYGLIQIIFAIAYVILYTVMILIIITLNSRETPLKFVIRTKYYLYFLFAVWAIWGIDYFNIAIIFFIFSMLPTVAVGTLKLLRYSEHA